MKLSLMVLTAITLFLASVVRSLGKLIVLRHPPTNDNTERDLTCLSENDDAALIWNDNFETDAISRFADFEPKKPPSNVNNCAIWNSAQCSVNWHNINKWDMVNSADRPMSPVLDYRWEGFKEFVFNEDAKYQKFQHVRKIEKSSADTIVFSVRGSHGVNILLCEYEQLNNGPCISIILGDLQNKRSEIKICTYGNRRECTVVATVSHKPEEIFDTSEWRTFTLNWNKTESKIQVLKTTDGVDKPFLIGIVDDKLNNLFNIFIKSDVSARFRFHFYDYYRTDNPVSTVYSQKFDNYEKNFCIKLLVGLCPECELRVLLEYSDGHSNKTPLIGIINGTEVSSHSGMLKWQSVKLNTELNISATKVRLMIQNFVTYGSNGSWAIGNIRMCSPVETARVSNITTKRKDRHSATWPVVKCQKLFYEEIEIVNSRSDTSIDANTHESDQLISSWLKSCGSSCKFSEKNLSICDPNGCTCDRGSNATGYCNPDFQPPLEVSDIENIEVNFLSATEVMLQWLPSTSKNGKTVYYNISIKRDKLIGCSALGKTTPEQKEIPQNTTEVKVTFANLHPYANYTATVLAYTTISAKPKKIMFQMPETDIPTSKISNLRLSEDNRKILWDEPEDCTTITGPYKRKMLVFEGVSESVKGFHARKYTTYKDYEISKLGELAHYESYRVRIYVMRSKNGTENSSCYQERVWRTPPTKPTAVNDLKIYEPDSDRRTVSLRWLEPQPPNGEIESYNLSIDGKTHLNINIIKNLTRGKICDQSEKYVCLRNLTVLKNVVANDLKIEIYARNKNVTKNGNVRRVTFMLNEIFTAPSKPQNLTASPKAHGIVNLKWVHPSISYTKIVRFNIRIEIRRSRLQPGYPTKQIIDDYSISEEQKNYSRKLYLLTSTSYKISVVAVNEKNLSSSEAQVITSVTAGIDFASKFNQISQNGTLINLKIPSVINATIDTMVSVMVNGVLKCNQNPVSSLVVYKYKPKCNESQQQTIDANNIHGNGSNCSLDIGKNYYFTVEAKDPNSPVLANFMTGPTISTEYKTQSFNWLTILPIIAICVIIIAIFIMHRKRRRTPMQESYAEVLPLSQSSSSTKRGSENISNSSNRRSSTPPLVYYTTENRLSSHVYAVPYVSESNSISTTCFEEYAKESAFNGVLNSQYTTFPRGLTRNCEYGRLPQNMPKNRNKNLVAYDETRVILDKIPGDPYSDYINANYIKGYGEESAYIATQGPKPNTINDFWRMIWQKKVLVICMLTNITEDGKTMCEKYWPDVGNQETYGDIIVYNVDHKVFADYTIRTFKLNNKNENTRTVMHLHYTGWPDHGVPMYPQSLITYLRKLVEILDGRGPVVIHCSSGDGRTGTIILCDMCVRQGIEQNTIEVAEVTKQMYSCRANMIDNPQQYLFAHIIIAESIMSIPTQVPCTNILPARIKTLRKQLSSHVQRLNNTVWQERALHSLSSPQRKISSNMMNKKLPELIQVSVEVDIYESYSDFDRDTNYINAVSVDGVKIKNQYLAAQLPSPSGLPDFWRYIAERNIELIVILQLPDSGDKMFCDIMPGESILVPVPYIQVETKSNQKEGELYTVDKLLLTDTSEEKARRQSVTVLTCSGWGCGNEGKPPSTNALVSLWQASENIPRKEGQTLVLCRDGITGCGLYLALSFLLERMAVERECDVISAVRAVRRSRPEFVQSMEQFNYLYEAAINYFESFQTYANFS